MIRREDVTEMPCFLPAPMIRLALREKMTEIRIPMDPQPSPHAGGFVWPGPTGFCWYPDATGGNIDLRRPSPEVEAFCPHGRVGDVLWVRETFRAEELENGLDGIRYRADGEFVPIADSQGSADRWLEIRQMMKGREWLGPGGMPRDVCRLRLEIKDVRVERLDDITISSIRAEGLISLELEDMLEMGYSKKAILACMQETLTHHHNVIKWDDTALRTMWWYSILPHEIFQIVWDLARGGKPGLRWKDQPWVWVVKFKKLVGGKDG